MLFKLTVIVLIATLALVTGSVMYRLQKMKPIMRTDFPETRFLETWCSGRSNRNLLARLAGAKKFLWVAVTKDHLHVSPHFPFSLMLLPEAFGLDHRVPGKSIIDVRDTSAGHAVLIQYRHATGDHEILELTVKNVPALMKALAGIRGS
jgi:hypothetical protein